jgi:CO/xanthine dehydrogenase FAD-binding subunit
MHDFRYAVPRSLGEMLKLLAKRGSAPQLLAGGTDLIVRMRIQRTRPGLVIDAKRVPELNVLKIDRTGLTVGAAVPCSRIYHDRRIAGSWPVLVDCTTLIGGIQIQNRATVGGNLCNAAPSADTIPALIVLGALARVRGATGSRRIPVEDFCTGPGTTALRRGEVLVSLHIPKALRRSGARFLRFIPRNEMDIAVANAAASVTLDATGRKFTAARIAIGAVAPVPLLVPEAGEFLAGRSVTESAIREAALIAAEAAQPITDMRGTVEQRRHLAGVLTARALRDAIRRAKGEPV